MEGKLGVVGMGRMGRCLIQGLTDAGTFTRENIHFTTRHTQTAEAAEKELGVGAMASNAELAARCSTLILAVKPQSLPEVLGQLKGKVTARHRVISIVASATLAQLEKGLSKKVPLVRAMPNTPVFVRAGITAACLNGAAEAADGTWDLVRSLFEPVGQLVQVDERHMDSVTGLSGCGPAYIYVVLESLTEAGIKVGLPRELASQLASQTVLGAAKMLQETGRHPAALKDEVTTPAGCTIDGLQELEDGKLRFTLIKAVVQATRRAHALSNPPE